MTRTNLSAAAVCITSWAKSIAGAGEVTDDAEVGGLIVAEAMNRLRKLPIRG